jgi:mannosyl-oligosaccharide alpha-1,2-mannosidase
VTKPTHQAHHNLFDKVTATFDARRKQQTEIKKTRNAAAVAAVVTTGTPEKHNNMAVNILNKAIGIDYKNHQGVIKHETLARDPVLHNNKIDVNKITHEVRPHLIMHNEGKTKKLPPITTINHGSVGGNSNKSNSNIRINGVTKQLPYGRNYLVKAKTNTENEEKTNTENEENDNSNMHNNNMLGTLEDEVQSVKRTLINGADRIGKTELQLVHNAMDYITQSEEKVVQGVHRGFSSLRGTSSSSQNPPPPSSSSSSYYYRGGLYDHSSDNIEQLEHYPYMTAPISTEHDFSNYIPPGGYRFIEYKDGDAPYLITIPIIHQSDELARSRRYHIKAAMKHVWHNYDQQSVYGKDEMSPLTGHGIDKWGGLGTTLVDSLDTLWIMDMKDEFYNGRDWVRDHLSFTHVLRSVSYFETSIRHLGGLLSAYDLSNDDILLQKATDLANRLIMAYDKESGLPRSNVDLSSGRSNNQLWNSNNYMLAEVATNQIENRYLSHVTNRQEYVTLSMKAFDIVRDLQPTDGLLFEQIMDSSSASTTASSGRKGGILGWFSSFFTTIESGGVDRRRSRKLSFGNSKVSFGACGDSAYEYMLKVWIQGGKKENQYRLMWDKAMIGMHTQLLQKSSSTGLTYIANRISGKLEHKMDHLVCFMGGTLALSAYTDPLGLDSVRAQRDLQTARALTYTCYQMYARTKTGIAPEYVRFVTNNGDENDMIVPSDAPYYILRPEAVEAFYYLSKLTGDPIYREWGWEVFQSIEKYCKTKYGYASIKDVNKPGSVEDRMESFFIAETLKYLYLLFDPDSEIDILSKVRLDIEVIHFSWRVFFVHLTAVDTHCCAYLYLSTYSIPKHIHLRFLMTRSERLDFVNAFFACLLWWRFVMRVLTKDC